MAAIARFSIAGLGVEIELDPAWLEALQGADFSPFRVAEIPEKILQMRLSGPDAELSFEPGELLDEDHNDMGHVQLYASGRNYRVSLCQGAGGRLHRMLLFADSEGNIDRAEVAFDPMDRYARQALSSLVRIAFSQAVLSHGALSIHASSVVMAGEAVLFLGKSGTGKSTHAARWCEAGAELLNDDNPLLRIEGERLVAYGTPWSGKTACYKNQSAPLRGIVRLSQAPQNRFERLYDMEAFVALLPSASVIRHSEPLHDRLCDLLGTMIERTKVAHLACRPDHEAYLCCLEGLR